MNTSLFNGRSSIIRQTDDYSMFKMLNANRDISDNHVNDLAVSLKKYGQINPIIVNENKEVIEGQHRLNACKLLKLPITYITVKNLNIEHVRVINNKQKGWKYRDYLKSFSHKSHPNHQTYSKINNFFEEFNLPLSVCLILLSIEDNKVKGDCHRTFISGNFVINDESKARKFAQQLLKIKSFAPDLVQIKKFCIGFARIQNLENFKVETAYEQIQKYRSKLEGCMNQEDWIEGLVDAYNFKLSKSNRISTRKEF
jgi:hypothetical protein